MLESDTVNTALNMHAIEFPTSRFSLVLSQQCGHRLVLKSSQLGDASGLEVDSVVRAVHRAGLALV